MRVLGGGGVGAIFDFKMENEAGLTIRFTSCPHLLFQLDADYIVIILKKYFLK